MNPAVWIYSALGIAFLGAGLYARPRWLKVLLFLPGFWILIVLLPALF